MPTSARGHSLLVCAGALVFLVTALCRPAQTAWFDPCRDNPEPATVEELGHVERNRTLRAARADRTRRQGPALLALSDGSLKLAYAAGLLSGWSETGERPDFAVVTAVGRSAILAPFAFIGARADAPLKALFHCEDLDSWTAFALEAMRLLDDEALSAIRTRHTSGARLLMVLPGSPVRAETLWDIGALVSDRRRSTAEIRRIVERLLSAAADPTLAPPAGPARAELVRNWAFREPGSGEAFFWPRDTIQKVASINLIHAGVLFADESDDFVAHRGHVSTPRDAALLPAAQILSEGRRLQAVTRFASVKPTLNIQRTVSGFDLPYMRDLFLRAFREGRMGKGWHGGLPTDK